MSNRITQLDRNPEKLWRFHGGIHLPDEKALSNQDHVRDVALPSRLVIPLQQHIGAPARACVAVGDHVKTGQLIGEAQGYVSANIHASSSGTVAAITTHPVIHPSGLPGQCIIIDTDGQDTWVDLPPPMTDFQQFDPDQLRARIRDAGIVGLGGASFPSHVKLNPGAQQPIHTVILNGVECEPYITCDDLLMRDRAQAILDGARIIQRITQAQRVLIGIEDNKPDAALILRQIIAQQALNETLRVVVIPTLYPSGGEKQLIRIVTGQEVPSHGIPAQIGIVCQNVGTAAAIADAVLRGQPLIERYVTVTGRGVVNPGNYRVRIGMLANELLAASGGYQQPVAKLIAGGPMMGQQLSSDAVPMMKATNCLLALSPHEAPDPGTPLPCIRCGRCAEACPVNLLPQQLYWHARAKDLEKVQDYNLFDCIECGCCAHVCPSHIPLVHYYRYAKTESWAREREKKASERARQRHAAREIRLERLNRERQEKLRRKKEALKAKPAAKPTPSSNPSHSAPADHDNPAQDN
jgi:electron transport complex protein RnfC